MNKHHINILSNGLHYELIDSNFTIPESVITSPVILNYYNFPNIRKNKQLQL